MLGALGAPRRLGFAPQSFVLAPQQQPRSKLVGVTWEEEAAETPGSVSDKQTVTQFLPSHPHRSNRLEKILPQKVTTSTDARILYTGHFFFSHGNEGTSSSLGFALLVRSVSRVQNQDRILPTPARLARESAPTRHHSLLALHGSRALSPHI